MARRVKPEYTNGSNGAHMKKGSRSPRTCCIAAGLLGARRERPRGCSATEKREKFASLHSITSSARASSLSGICSPSAFAAFRLITKWYFVGNCTGRSPGFSPRRMRSM